jgi:hypothetical protein
MNFLCVSNHNNDLSWLDKYPNGYIIYDRSDSDEHVKGRGYVKSPNVGYNIYDMMTFIIDHYDALPDYTTFCKGNIVPRHVSLGYFESVMNNRFYTPIFDYELHNPEMPVCMFSSDGLWSERNDSWYLRAKNPRHFNDYNQLLVKCFSKCVIPKYVTFAPGGNYVLPREMILKYDVGFYKTLRGFIDYTQLPPEAHAIERLLHTMWTCNFPVKESMNK